MQDEGFTHITGGDDRCSKHSANKGFPGRWFLKLFSTSHKFVSSKGNGTLKAHFTTKSSGWRKNREVFELEWEEEYLFAPAYADDSSWGEVRRMSMGGAALRDHDRGGAAKSATITGGGGKVRAEGAKARDTGGGPRAKGWDALQVSPPISRKAAKGGKGKGSGGSGKGGKGVRESVYGEGGFVRKEVVGLFAIKAANDKYWMVLDSDETDLLAVGLPPVKKRMPSQLFMLEVYDGHLFAWKSVKTNCYVCVSTEGPKEKVCCSSEKLTENCLFRLNLKTGFRTGYQNCYIGNYLHGSLVPCSKKYDKRETFFIQLEEGNKFSVMGSTGRFWRIEKSGVLSAKSKNLAERVSEEYFHLLHKKELKLYIESCTTKQLLSYEEDRRLIFTNGFDNTLFTLVPPPAVSNSPASPSLTSTILAVGGGIGWWSGQKVSAPVLSGASLALTPQAGAVMKSMGAGSVPNMGSINGSGGEDGPKEDVSNAIVASPVQSAVHLSLNRPSFEDQPSGDLLHHFRRRIKLFVHSMKGNLATMPAEATPKLLAGERVMLHKDHILHIRPKDAILGTGIITNYKFIFVPTNGAYEKFSTPLCNLMRIAHVGELSYGANSGKHQCFQLCLRDLRDMYFSTLPFAPRKKPKVQSFLRTLHDYAFPSSAIELFAFTHYSALHDTHTEIIHCAEIPLRDALFQVRYQSWRGHRSPSAPDKRRPKAKRDLQKLFSSSASSEQANREEQPKQTTEEDNPETEPVDPWRRGSGPPSLQALQDLKESAGETRPKRAFTDDPLWATTFDGIASADFEDVLDTAHTAEEKEEDDEGFCHVKPTLADDVIESYHGRDTIHALIREAGIHETARGSYKERFTMDKKLTESGGLDVHTGKEAENVSTPSEAKTRGEVTPHEANGEKEDQWEEDAEGTHASENALVDTSPRKRKKATTKVDKEFLAVRYMPFLTGKLPPKGWHVYNPLEDYQRLGLNDGPWRVSSINLGFTLCESYPPVLVVPSFVTDSDLLEIANFRSKGRIPTIVWRHAQSGSVLVRCSQPHIGLLSKHCPADEKLFESLRLAMGVSGELHLIDARPKVNAMANTIKGAGVETMNAMHNSYRTFLGIENIHVMRDCHQKLRKLCEEYHYREDRKAHNDQLNHSASGRKGRGDNPRESEERRRRILDARHEERERVFAAGLLETEWLHHQSAILRGALMIVKLMLGLPIEEGEVGDGVDWPGDHRKWDGSASWHRREVPVAVVTHCSDGWDRTPQLTALVQLMLDPFYRTVVGFEVLIEKEFIAFGHRFAERVGHGTKESRWEARKSPVFHQFIECVWQLTHQFPTAFEFNEKFLKTILKHLYSCRFGTFLFDSLKERTVKGAERTCSLWSFINSGQDVDPSPDDDAFFTARSAEKRGKGKEKEKDSFSGGESIEDQIKQARKVEKRRMQKRKRYTNPKYQHDFMNYLLPGTELVTPYGEATGKRKTGEWQEGSKGVQLWKSFYLHYWKEEKKDRVRRKLGQLHAACNADAEFLKPCTMNAM